MFKSAVIADHFLFHALMEIARKPVAHIVTTTEGETYLHEMHATAIRQEGSFNKDIIVVHLDERTNKYRVLLEPKKATPSPADRDGMSSTLTLPSLRALYGEDYVPTAHKHRRSKVDDTKYQVDITSSPGGMEVTVDELPLGAYSPDTQAHVLSEINLQGAAGGGHTQIPPLSHGGKSNA
jgi:hypothetical protein